QDVEELKRRHIEHLSPLADRIDASILRYHMPVFMRQEIVKDLAARTASDRLNEVLNEANHVRRHIGYPPLVAPLRQMIAIQAVNNVLGGGQFVTVTTGVKHY